MSADARQARAEALGWLASADTLQQSERAVAPYLEAAAVLSTFIPRKIRPTPSGFDIGEEALFELTDRAVPVGPPELDTWQLEEGPRRSALRRLGTRPAMQAARNLYPSPVCDPLQRAIDLLIGSDQIANLTGRRLEDLLALECAIRWFDGILENLPPKAEVLAAIERERHLLPMRKIAGEGFVDRVDFLNRLEDYVGVLPSNGLWRDLCRSLKHVVYSFDQRPPLHFFGPGGIGKSALLARFILDHADHEPVPGATRLEESQQQLPFIYLDFDRTALDPRVPETLLQDAIRQLLIEFPSVDSELLALGPEFSEYARGIDGQELAKSPHFRSQEELLGRFCRLLAVIANQNQQPVLMVLDTLEEAEFQGLGPLQVTWDLLRTLLARVDRLRIVTAGRSPLPPDFQREAVELTGLPTDAAVELLTRKTAALPGGPVSEHDAREIVSLVGPVPLSLMLAARVFLHEGLDGLKSAVGRQFLFSRIKSEQQQGMLYQRILGHVRAHDSRLEKLANPGLIVRRITTEIITEVLAESCGLELRESWEAERLFEDLARETGLVDSYREPGALWHLLPVRRIMLPELRRNLGSVATAIDQAAARYYESRPNPSPVEQAEAIYHRLWLCNDATTLDHLWQPSLAVHLRGAFEDFEPQAKVWLGDKLGIELDPHLRSLAAYGVWERQAGQRARILLGRGMASEALAALRERTRAEASPLFALEADALKLLGRPEEALHIAQTGLSAALQVGDQAIALPLLLRKIFLLEASEAFTDSLAGAREAVGLARRLREPLDVLSAGVAVLRLVRKLQKQGMPDSKIACLIDIQDLGVYQSKLQAEMGALVEEPSARAALRSRPALLQEAAAELGLIKVDLLEEAVSLLGISPEDHLAFFRHDLNRQQADVLFELENIATTRGVGQAISILVPIYPEFFVESLAQKVDDGLRLTLSSTSPMQSLGADHSSEIVKLIVDDFTPKDLGLLTFDTFEIKLEEIADPRLPFERQVWALLVFAQRKPAFRHFLTRLARSRPENAKLARLAEMFGKTAT